MADYRAAKMEIHQHSQHILINRDDPQTLPMSVRCGRASASTATAMVAASWMAVTG
jgi:UDP-N-acetylmuramoylalanine-D-glutamate ligase